MKPRVATGSLVDPRAIFMVLAFAAVSTLNTAKVVSQLNVPGQPYAGRFALMDFRDAIYYPVVALLDGRNPYDTPRYKPAYPVDNAFPLYAPSTLAVHLPFGLLPYESAEILYYSIALALTPVLAWLTLRLAGFAGTLGQVFGLASLLLLSRPGQMNLFLGQYTATVAVGAYAAFYFAERRPWLAALGLAVTTLKPTFGAPLAVLMLAHGYLRPVVIGLALGATLAAGPVAALAQGAGGLVPFLASLSESQKSFEGTDSVNPLSSAIRIDTAALLGRVADHPLGVAGQLVVAFTVLAIGALASRRAAARGGDGGRAASAGLMCLTVLVCMYHQVYDALLLALPLTTLAFKGPGAPAHPAVRLLLFALLAVPAVNYFSSVTAISSLGIQGPAWVLVTSLNAIALTMAFALAVTLALARRDST